MQLLSLGAPGELIEACNRALADETAHTRLCFGLATRYAGTTLGPGKLEVRDCFEDMSLLAIAKLVLREGCIGETVAALEAVEAAERATDPAVKGVLTRIARDEQAHAELAFEFLTWAAAQCSASDRAELARACEVQLADFERPLLSSDRRASSDEALSAHGLLGDRATRLIHWAAAREVVRPLLSALMGQELQA